MKELNTLHSLDFHIKSYFSIAKCPCLIQLLSIHHEWQGKEENLS